MVFQKRLNSGFNGYQAREMPRLPKSAKGKRSARRRVDENQMYAFDLLAAVAGKILTDRESSFKSGDFDKIKKEILEEVKPYRDDAFDQASCNESTMDKKIIPKQSDFTFKDPKVFPSSDLLEKDAKFGELAPISVKEVIADQTEIREETLEDPMVLDVKPSTLASSDSSVEVPQYSDHDHHDNSCVCYRDNVEINIAGDDDDNMSRCTHPGTRTTRAFKAHRVGDRRIRKLAASKHWKATTVLPRNGEFSNTEVEMPIYRSRKLCCTHQRTQRSSFKRRKVLERCSVAALGAGAGWDGNCNFLDKEIMAEVSNSHTAQRGANDASASMERSSYEADDYRVKLSIKSFKVPELFIEIPETATVGSLKRTVMEAVTAVLGGGLRVGVLLQGKKVRDDNKTLHQAGISRDNKIDCVGFTLEPNPKAVPAKASPQLASPDMSCQLPCDAPRPLARIPPASPVLHSRASGTIPDTPLIAPLMSIPESDHDSVQSVIVEGNSGALVPVPPVFNTESLSVVPMRKSRRSEIVQRRIRRPFSVAEVEALVHAVEKLGTGRWRDVKLQAFDHAKHRTYVDLKDKWKTLVHTARIAPQQRRGEPVPQELLDRVLAAQAYWSKQQAKLQDKLPLAEPCLLH